MNRACIALFTLFVVSVDVAVAWVWYHQLRSDAFPVTQGEVLKHSEVPAGGKRTRPMVEYRYEVNGVEFVSDHVWYGLNGTNSIAFESVLKQLPPGAPVTVSFNPANPAEAVLFPGLQGTDVMSLWFLYVINFFLVLGSNRIHPQPPAAAIYRVPPADAASTAWRLVLPAPSLWLVVLVTLALPAFASFCVARVGFGMLPTLGAAVGLAIAAIVVTLVWVLLTRKVVWLDVDTVRRELRWHSGSSCSATEHIPFEAVTAIRVEEIPGDEGPTVWAAIEYSTPENRTRTIHLPRCYDRGPVEATADWLRTMIGLSTDTAGPMPRT